MPDKLKNSKAVTATDAETVEVNAAASGRSCRPAAEDLSHREVRRSDSGEADRLRLQKFDAELEELTEDMFASMYAAQGVGLAAPQIGKNIRLTVVDVTGGKNPEAKIVLVNPEIIHAEGEKREEEGCLSIPGFRGYVVRPQFVTVRAQNAKGETFEIRGEDLLARAFCHEIDHLNGDFVYSAPEHAEARFD